MFLEGGGFLLCGVFQIWIWRLGAFGHRWAPLVELVGIGSEGLLRNDIVEALISSAGGIEVWSRVVVVGNIRRLHRSIVEVVDLGEVRRVE